MTIMTPIQRVVEGTIGFSTPLAAVVISLQDIEAYLRITSLVIGILVGLVTLYRLLRKPK